MMSYQNNDNHLRALLSVTTIKIAAVHSFHLHLLTDQNYCVHHGSRLLLDLALGPP